LRENLRRGEGTGSLGEVETYGYNRFLSFDTEYKLLFLDIHVQIPSLQVSGDFECNI
jgi:hypothetical protein